MSAFLLAWNPNRWKWTNLPEVVSAFESGKAPIQRWSCGNVKQIDVGDRVFLIRLVADPKGIFGFGTITHGSYEDVHWEDRNRTSQYVKFQVDWIVNPLVSPIISRSSLETSPLSQMHWDTQMSGIRIPDDVATALTDAWSDLVEDERFSLADEISDFRTYSEGTRRTIIVNSFERNPRARQACIAHYGSRCTACGIDFGETYGEIAEGLIHVHHLTPLSGNEQSRDVDPVQDLCPVCPNCHAVIHRRSPPVSIDEVKSLLRDHRETRGTSR